MPERALASRSLTPLSLRRARDGRGSQVSWGGAGRGHSYSGTLYLSAGRVLENPSYDWLLDCGMGLGVWPGPHWPGVPFCRHRQGGWPQSLIRSHPLLRPPCLGSGLGGHVSAGAREVLGGAGEALTDKEGGGGHVLSGGLLRLRGAEGKSRFDIHPCQSRWLQADGLRRQ